jgi:hypothetical protein
LRHRLMSTFRPPLQPRSAHPPPAELQGETDRHTWLDLAGILLLLVGFFNIIDGIAAISDSSYVSPHVLFSNLHAWGWFFLIVGIVQIIAGWAVMQGAGWAAILGMLTAFVNAIGQLSAAHTFTVWALTIVAIDVLVIYGLARYGGGRGRAG